MELKIKKLTEEKNDLKLQIEKLEKWEVWRRIKVKDVRQSSESEIDTEEIPETVEVAANAPNTPTPMFVDQKDDRDDGVQIEIPIQKVLDILEQLREKLKGTDGDQLDYVIRIIKNDDLYQMDFSKLEQTEDKETAAWLQQEMGGHQRGLNKRLSLKAYVHAFSFMFVKFLKFTF